MNSGIQKYNLIHFGFIAYFLNAKGESSHGEYPKKLEESQYKHQAFYRYDSYIEQVTR